MDKHTPSFLAPRTGRMEQVASIRRLTADDGKGRGMRVLEVDGGNGLAFTVHPDRGMDIGAASFRGTPLAWLSCNGDVAPAFYDPSGLEWLRTWGGGLLTGCGLLNVGGPNNAGGEAHGLHGRLSHLPAEEVNTHACWSDDGTYSLTAQGRMRHTKVFGEKLVTTRTITTSIDTPAITVSDRIENQGFAPVPLMLLYHINLGWPLVDEKAFLEAAPHAITAQNDDSARALDNWAQITAPVKGFKEQVFYHELPPDRDGVASIRLVNPNIGLALRLSYRVAELPHLIQWKMMGEGEYVIGLEPANCYPEGQAQFSERGGLRHLASGEKIETFIRFAVEVL